MASILNFCFALAWWFGPLIPPRQVQAAVQAQPHSLEGCVTPSRTTVINANMVGHSTVQLLEAMASSYKNQTGQRLTVVMLARAGTDPTGIFALNDDDGQGGHLALEQIVDRALRKDRLPPVPLLTADQGRDLQFTLDNDFSLANSRQVLGFTHLGFAWDGSDAGSKLPPEQRWKVSHVLKPCDNDEPRIFLYGLANFFVENPHRLAAKFWIFKPEIQNRVVKILKTRDLAEGIMAPFYRLGSTYKSEESLNYANSNNWPLEVLALAKAPDGSLRNRRQAVEFLKSQGYSPQKLRVSGFAAAFVPSVGFVLPSYMTMPYSEHPLQRFMVFEAVTAESVGRWAHSAGLLEPSMPPSEIDFEYMRLKEPSGTP